MKPREYIKKALRTEIQKYKFSKTGDVSPRLEHAILGIANESGEIIEDLKSSKIYGKKLDKIHLIEEMGDIFWFLALLADELKVSFEDIWEINIRKLKARYPKKYSDKGALNRKPKKERKQLKQ